MLGHPHDSTDPDKNFLGRTVWSATPTDELERAEFWEVVDESMTCMPDGVATAFKLSVIERQDTATICRELNISSGNLWVRLHRARNYLAHIVNDQWNDGRYETTRS